MHQFAQGLLQTFNLIGLHFSVGNLDAKQPGILIVDKWSNQSDVVGPDIAMKFDTIEIEQYIGITPNSILFKFFLYL